MTGTPTRKVFTLLVEMRCDSYCVFCGQRQVDAGLVKARRSLGLSTPATVFGDLRGTYTLETATSALRAARDDGYKELSLQGGEPTLFGDIVPLVASARTMGFEHIGLVTNGRRLADRAFTEALLDAGLDGLTFSVLGYDAASHDAVAIAPGAFDALMEGLTHARAAASRLDRRVTLNVNLVTTRRTVDHLAAQVRMLSEAGADAATILLVRFDGVASEPAVVESLGFDVREITPRLEEAWRATGGAGMSLHATDLPPCVHPALRSAELELIERRTRVTRHHFRAAAFEYDIHPRGHGPEPACEGCVLALRCPRVPPEYLPAEPSDALRPLTPASLRARIDAALAALDPRARASVDEVGDLARSVATLARMANPGADLTSTSSRLEEALGDLALLALARGDTDMVLSAFGARAGLDPPAWSGEAVRRAAGMGIFELARAADGVDADREKSECTLHFGEGFDVALFGVRHAPHEARYTRARAALRRPRGQGDRLLFALFLGCLCPALRGPGRVRVTPTSIDVDAGAGSVAWSRARDSEAGLVVG